MLIKLGEVEELLADALAIDALAGARLPRHRLVNIAEVLDLRLGDFQLVLQVLDAVMVLLLRTTDDADEGAMRTAEDDHRALFLVLEQLVVR